MTIRLAAPLALIAFVCAVPMAAAAPDGDAHTGHATESTPTDDEAKADKTRKVCRTETRTGSNMPRRVCRTVAQMEDDERRAEQFRDQQNRMGASAR
jgi:hypothetical protein